MGAALSRHEAAALDAPHLVHACDAAGAYLGRLQRDQAAQVATSAPPPGNWRWLSGAWHPAPTLAELKAAKWGQIKDRRAAQARGTFTAGGRVFDVDLPAINAAAFAAARAVAAGQSFSRRWVLANNASVVLTAAQLVQLADACEAYVSALWDTSIDLRAQIDAATTPAQVAAIRWPG